jgi:Ca-activated chloride channel family protein
MREQVLRWVVVGGLCTVAPLAGRAQEPQATPDQAPPVFKARSDLVVLHVNVFNGKSDAVPDLPRSAFEVLDDGKPQPITFFSSVDVPVAVGLVIDNSTSMLTRRNMVLAGGRAFAESSHPEDQVFTVVFNENVRDTLPSREPFTQSHSIIEGSLLRYPPGGKTAVYDAVITGLAHLQQATLQKKVLVVLTDGDDNASKHSKQDMLHRAMRSDALIYTVFTGDLAATRGDPDVLKKLAAITGGAFYSPDTEMQVVETFTAVAQNIRRGYSIGFVPQHGDTDYHRVKVLVRAPGFKQLAVRVRDGYSTDETNTD